MGTRLELKLSNWMCPLPIRGRNLFFASFRLTTAFPDAGGGGGPQTPPGPKLGSYRLDSFRFGLPDSRRRSASAPTTKDSGFVPAPMLRRPLEPRPGCGRWLRPPPPRVWMGRSQKPRGRGGRGQQRWQAWRNRNRYCQKRVHS